MRSQIIIACLYIIILSSCVPCSAFLLVQAGRPAATIVIPDNPLPVVLAAAEELRYHIAKSSGAVLPIVKEGECKATSGRLFLGACKATQALGFAAKQLPINGYHLGHKGKDVYLIGDDSPGDVFGTQHNNRTRVGTLFAVYDILEKQLGVRWLWPGPLGEIIPPRKTIDVALSSGTYAPPFLHARWRDGGYIVAGVKGWANPQNRLAFLKEQSKWLRRHRFALGVNMDIRHAYTNWWDKYHKTHPEFFNLLPEGTRRPDPFYYGGTPSLISMCVSNPDFIRETVAQWAATRSPENPYLDASENDTPGKCVCDGCMALDEPDPDNLVPFAQRRAEAQRRFAAGDPQWHEALGSLSDRYARTYLAIQAAAQKIDPDVVVMGFAYANYYKPPRRTKLNERIIIGIVPALMFPWTSEKRERFYTQWDGWRATGARLLLRPNYMLDGHNLPINFALALGEDFSYAAQHGMIGTDFDSLTGQYAIQGPNLYMLARLHAAPRMRPSDVLAEYYSAFGKAREAVRNYWAYWATISAQVTDETINAAHLHWTHFYRDADVIFTPGVMAFGRKLLEKAQKAAQGDTLAEARVAFLAKGLNHAEMTLAVQRAFRLYRSRGQIEAYMSALQALDEFRAAHEAAFIANMGYLAWAEEHTWDRELITMMAQPGIRLADPWKFMWDPEKRGEKENWFAPDFDDHFWYRIATTAPWEQQEVGQQWREAFKKDYDGLAWYRTTFSLPSSNKPQQIRLIFGAVDEACKIWLNGERVHERPYPYQGNIESWKEAFEVNITPFVRRDKPNVLAVLVEDNGGAGGIWKPVWLSLSDAPSAANLVPDGGFEADPPIWGQHIQIGDFRFARDTNIRRSGQASGFLECLALGPEEKESQMRTRAWARWYRSDIVVDPEKSYRLRAWYRTNEVFSGTVRLWITGTKEGTREARGLNTQGIWRELRLENIKPQADKLGIYFNVMDGLGKVWLDDVELTEQSTPSS